MGYAAEKKTNEEKWKKVKRIVFCVLAVLILALAIFSAIVPMGSWKYYFNLPTVDKREEGELRIHYIDVGQGDATLIELPDGKVMLVDGGNGSTPATDSVMRYLNALQIQTIDYLVVTHTDSDHCGGLQTVLDYKQVNRAFLPVISESTTSDSSERFYSALVKEKNCSYEQFSRNIALGKSSSNPDCPYTLSFLYPESEDVSTGKAPQQSNLASAVFWLDYNGVSALFSGDAPQEVEIKLKECAQLGLLWKEVELNSTEIYKAAHHGSSSSSNYVFLEYLHAQTAVISCGKDNAYGFPSAAVSQNLNDLGIQTYRTDLHGSICITVKADATYTVETLGGVAV